MKKWICSSCDHIDRVALQCLLKDWNSIWSLEANAALRSRRKNPNLLFKGSWGHSGDELAVPDPELDSKPAETLKKHIFQTPASKLRLRLRILDMDRRPAKNSDYSILFEGEIQPRTGRTDFRGQIVIPNSNSAVNGKPLSRAVSKATLTVRLPAKRMEDGSLCSATSARWDLWIGGLNPIQEDAPDRDCVSGIQHRLNNLGFFAGLEYGVLNPATRDAIRRFQKMYGLPADGEPSSALQEKLAAVHDRPDSIVPPAKQKKAK